MMLFKCLLFKTELHVALLFQCFYFQYHFVFIKACRILDSMESFNESKLIISILGVTVCFVNTENCDHFMRVKETDFSRASIIEGGIKGANLSQPPPPGGIQL